MLKVQLFLAQHGLDALKERLAIEVVSHPCDPLVILNYSQIDSPKADPVVRECRGLTLERDTWKVAAKAFDRFFNWGELAHEAKTFDWSDFQCRTKEDGSLILIYHYRGTWRVNTRGSFGNDVIYGADKVWRELVLERLGDVGRLDPGLTYVCELVSPHNRVVRRYETTNLVLLSAFRTDADVPSEVPDEEATEWGERLGLPRPAAMHFHSVEEILAHLAHLETRDPTFEGVVVRDRHNHRWKIKNRGYLCFKGVVDEKGFTDNPKLFLPFILSGEEDEFLAYFPQVREAFAACKARVESAYERLKELWEQTRDIPEQKQFALAIQKKSPFFPLLFALRKALPAEKQSEQELRRLWRGAEPQILDWLKKSRGD